MKALSLKQPWAWLIFNGKDVENRKWATKYRGQLLIHASKKWDAEGEEFILSHLVKKHRILIPRGLPSEHHHEISYGAIVGMVDVINCVRQYDSPWFFGPYGFVLRNALRFKKPFPFKGALGLFEVPKPIVKEVAWENMVQCAVMLDGKSTGK
jgi:hypothetical protein